MFLYLLFYVVFLQKKELRLFPAADFNVDFFTDSAVGGNSRILDFNVLPSNAHMLFTLQKGFMNPYVGVNVFAKNKLDFDLSDYNAISLELESANVNNLIVYFFIKEKDNKNREIIFSTFLEISNKRTIYNLNLKDFKIPDWWYDVNRISPRKKLKADWKQTLRLNIATGQPTALNKNLSLTVHSIVITKNNGMNLGIMGLVWIVIFIVLAILHYRKSKLTKPNSITINYQPVNVKVNHYSKENFLEFLNTNFHDSSLTLDIVAEKTNTNARHITSTIQEQFACNFKSYLNQIRIIEAKRLLKETSLNIGEIAFAVGFNSPHHFNRVFKSIAGISPSEYKTSK